MFLFSQFVQKFKKLSCFNFFSQVKYVHEFQKNVPVFQILTEIQKMFRFLKNITKLKFEKRAVAPEGPPRTGLGSGAARHGTALACAPPVAYPTREDGGQSRRPYLSYTGACRLAGIEVIYFCISFRQTHKKSAADRIDPMISAYERKERKPLGYPIGCDIHAFFTSFICSVILCFFSCRFYSVFLFFSSFIIFPKCADSFQIYELFFKTDESFF